MCSASSNPPKAPYYSNSYKLSAYLRRCRASYYWYYTCGKLCKVIITLI